VVCATSVDDFPVATVVADVVDDGPLLTDDKKSETGVNVVAGGRPERGGRARRDTGEAETTVDQLDGRDDEVAVDETRRDLGDSRDYRRDLAGGRDLDLRELRAADDDDDDDFGRRSADRDVDYDYIFGDDDSEELVIIIIVIIIAVALECIDTS